MRNKLKWLLLFICACFVSACSGMEAFKSDDFHGLNSESVYIAQPRDLTHKGALVEGSGIAFMYYLKQAFAEGSATKIRVLIPELPTQSVQSVDVPEAFSKADSIGADYILIVILGEMRDAAPMTFRKDFVSLSEAVLYRRANKKEVWRAMPYRVEGGNLLQYNRLLKEMARDMARNIAGNERNEKGASND